MRPPRGLLFDYGGTLVDEVSTDARAGMRHMLSRAAAVPAGLDLELLSQRADRVTREVADRRDLFQVETPWPSLTRLIYDAFGIRFDVSLAELETEYWDASVIARPMPGAVAALREMQGFGIPMGLVSNSSFSARTMRHELEKHSLAEFLSVVVTSAEYAVRKPNPLLFEVAAELLGVPCADVWFVGDRLDTDIAGARAAGMTAVWFAPSAGLAGTAANAVAPDWATVAEMTRRWNAC